ncbi:MAG: hypothetical protein NMK33_04730 [Candidatus Cardinium sp.]|nr:MAG: hypothetical protein NMK33_04730 [Candidatus Cardinium sp.]
MYKQQDAQSLFSYSVQDFSDVKNRPVRKDLLKARCPGIVCFDFFTTLFLFDYPKCSSTIESEVFPANQNTVYTFDAMVRSLGGDSDTKVGKMAIAMFHGKVQLWQKKDSDAWKEDANPRKPIYNALHVAPLVKSSLEAKKDWLRDPEALTKLIAFLLNHNYKVAFYGFLQCPHLMPFTLQHIGLTEKQVSNIYMVCFNSKFESDIACMCAIYHMIPKLNVHKSVDYQLILGDRFYAYARRCGRSGGDSCQNQKVVHIAMPMSGSNVYCWDHFKKLLIVLYHLIQTAKTSDQLVSWQAGLDDKLTRMGYAYKIIK